MSLLTTTTDGQQVFLTQPILTSGGSDPTAGIVFTQNPGPGGPKTVVLQDGGDHHGVPGTSGLQYIIEDPETGEGTLLDFASAGQQVQAGNLVLSQEDLDVFMSGVALQNEHHHAIVPQISFTSEPLERKILQKIPSNRQVSKLEKPIGRGPFPCELCVSLPHYKPFETWAKYKKHVKTHENDKRYKCPKCPNVSYNLEKNFRLHAASHNIDDLVCPECRKPFSRVASFRSHLQIHEEEDDLICSFCEALFNTENALNSHIESDHGTGPDPPKESIIFNNFAQPLPVQDHDFEGETYDEDSKADLKFSCKICQVKLKTSKQYSAHMEHHNKLKQLLKLKCKKKKKLPPSKAKLLRNECRTCGKKFQKPSQLLRHERIHSGVKPFMCKFCKKTFNQKNSLDLHLRKHTGEKPYKCEFCQMSFTQNGNLRSHIKRVHSIETDEPLLRCDECSCTFKKVGSLNSHFSRVHTKISITEEVQSKKPPDDLLFKALNSTGLPSIAPKEDPKTTKKVIGSIVVADKAKDGKKHLIKVYKNDEGIRFFLCNFCPKEFKKPSDLCRHLRVHSLEKPFKCRLCSRSFAVKRAYQSHMKIHTAGGMDHLCTICLKRFKTTGLLRSHQKSHLKDESHQKIDVGEPLVMTTQGYLQAPARHRAVYQPTRRELLERNHRCASCPAAFKKIAHLKAHSLRHTGEKPFKCATCDKQFVSRGGLNEHVRSVHTRDTVFQCSFCPLTFTTQGSTRRHMTSAHRKERPFMCPFCQKTFKTSVLCKKHMKIHRKDLALKDTIQDDPDIGITNTVINTHANTTTTLTTIETSDMTNTIQMNTQPASELQQSAKNDATFFTADSSGTVTLPNYSSAQPMNISQSEIMANIASDGTIITLQQNDQLDLNSLQLSTNDAGLFLPNLVSTTVKKEIQKCDLCQQILLDSTEHNCKIIEITKEEQQPLPMLFCSFKKCGSTFENQQELEDHMQTYHQPPFSPAKQPSTSSANTAVNKPAKKSVKFKASVTEERKEESISEKVWEASMNERYQVSRMKDPMQPDEEIHVHKCNICPRSFKKPSDLVRHIRTHTGEKPYKCEECGKSFSVGSTLNTHKKIHQRVSKQNAPDSIKCHICEHKFLSKNALKCHMRLHTGVKPYECPYCGERFRTSGHRKAHIYSIHPAVSETEVIKHDHQSTSHIREELPKALEQKFEIPAESFKSALEAAQNAGEPILGATVSLQLKQAGMETIPVSLQVDENLLSQLNKGQSISLVLTNPNPESAVQQNVSQIPTAMPPPPVEVAQDSLVSGNWSSAGTVYITDELPSIPVPHDDINEQNNDKICPLCRKVFAKPSMLQRHMRIHTGEKPFECPVCQKSFNQKNSLQTHMRKHTGDRPHTCPFCENHFTQKGNLKTHIQRSHPEDANLMLKRLENENGLHENSLVVIETITTTE